MFSIYNTLETLFWSTLGQSDLTSFRTSPGHFITEWAGKTMFGAYLTIATVVLLNMLIAMMSNSYAHITVSDWINLCLEFRLFRSSP